MHKLNKGIILEDCLISFLILSTFLVLMTGYMQGIYEIKNEIATGFRQTQQLKECMLVDCELSSGNNLRPICEEVKIKSKEKSVCIEI